MDLTYSDNTIKKPTNLVFSGGGILGIAYVGCLAALEEKKMLTDVKNFAGASAGAITALCCAIGYTSEQMNQVLKDTPFPELMDTYSKIDIPKMLKDWVYALECIPWVIKDLTDHLGLCKGEKARAWFGKLLKDKGYSPEITFGELFEETNKGLSVINCDVSTKTQKIRSHLRSPDMRVADAILTSMSIPFVYHPVISDNDTMVDGGTTYNCPVDIFDKENTNTLAFILSTKDSIIHPPPVKIDNIIQFAVHLISTFRYTSYALLFAKKENVDRTVFIDTYNISFLAFDIGEKDRQKLIDSGKNSTLAYLNR